MDLFQLLQGVGINPSSAVNGGIVGAVIIISQLIKDFIPLKIPDRAVPLIPVVLGSIAAFTQAQPLTLQNYWNVWLMYVPLSTFLFKIWKTTIAGK
jgi:hypothetical protein